jgi:RNA polymerase sigma-70 factor (sigma-E family)
VYSKPSRIPAVLAAPAAGASSAAPRHPAADAEAAVTELYQAHALGLTRLAHVMLGDRTGAEDVVQEAFDGLYRHWDRLKDTRKAPQYLRSSVLNGCRTELRRGRRRGARLRYDAADSAEPPAGGAEQSAEAAVMAGEDRREVLAAITRLPNRQREVLVLRYYLDEPDADIASSLGITAGTVRSTLHRALASLGADLREKS